MAVDGRIRELWILHHATIFGGADRFVLKLARHADAEDLRVRFLCQPDSELADRCRAGGLDVIGVDYPDFVPPAVFRAPATLARLHRLLRDSPPEAAIVASGPRPQAYGSSSRPGRALVHLAHEQDTALRPSARFVLPRTGVVVAIGANSAQAYSRALGVPVRSVCNILEDEDLVEAARARGRDRAAPRAPRLGALVRLIPEKGVLELVDELAGWPDAWSELRVGAMPQDPDYARAVEERIDAHGLRERIFVAGSVFDVPGFLSEVDVLVVPSTGREGQPTAILEALAGGVPAVVREPIWSEDFAGLPVAPYRGRGDLATALQTVPRTAVPLDELRRRFGPAQALEGVLSSALTSRAAAPESRRSA